LVDGAVLPAGATGRVAATSSPGVASGASGAGHEGDRIEVVLIDGRRATYLRDELTPRKLGVARYAQRRDAAWRELHGCIAVDAVVGSRAWGVAHEGSDEDHRGVFVLPAPWLTGLAEPPLDLVSLDGSRTYWEIGKAVRQALRADPNTLEMLFASPTVIDPIAGELVAMRDGFLSQEIYGAFGRYALSQLDRLEHNQRLAEHRVAVIGWLRDDPALELDAAAVRLADAAAVAAPSRVDAVSRAREYIKQLYRSMYDQGLIAANDWASLRAAAATELELPRDLRPKNAYNLIRLLDLAIRWLSGEPPEVRASDAIRPTLLAIKRGELAMADVMALARELTPRLEAARQASRLPKRGDIGRAEQVLRAVRDEAARRHLARAPGPWGAAAAPPPQARFDD
jgi:hypothetical protein